MAKCKDCAHFVVCQLYTDPEEEFPECGGCELFMPAADVVEVVRCRDCKHLMFSDFYMECSRGYSLGIVSPYDYCSRGERRKGEGE